MSATGRSGPSLVLADDVRDRVGDVAAASARAATVPRLCAAEVENDVRERRQGDPPRFGAT